MLQNILRSRFQSSSRFFSNLRYVNLSDSRSLILVRGNDRIPFLQSIITNDIQNLEVLKTLYSFMLNAKGRVMFDILLYDLGDDQILVECDRELSPKVFKHMSMYKIRKKVELIKDPDFQIGHLLGDLAENDVYDYELNGKDLSFWDPRQVKFGKRTLKPIENVISASLEDYTDARYQIGIAEGSNEIEFGKSFPLEYNLDHLSGISFHKGCYLGQELTARTFHTGVTRKRIVPLQLPTNWSSDETEFRNAKGRRAGKLICSNQNGNSLAMLRVENIDKPIKLGDHTIEIGAPSWWKRNDPKTLSFGICDDFRHADYESFSYNY